MTQRKLEFFALATTCGRKPISASLSCAITASRSHYEFRVRVARLTIRHESLDEVAVVSSVRIGTVLRYSLSDASPLTPAFRDSCWIPSEAGVEDLDVLRFVAENAELNLGVSNIRTADIDHCPHFGMQDASTRVPAEAMGIPLPIPYDSRGVLTSRRLSRGAMETPTDPLAVFLVQSSAHLVVLARVHLDRRLWPKIDPEDVAQQTLQEAWVNADRLRELEPGRQAAWLRSALLHNVFDAVRSLRRQKCDPRLEQAIDRSSNRLADSIAGADSTPSLRAVRNEQMAQLATALTQLPPDQQTAVVLHHLQGLKLSEVAEHLGRSLTAVAGLIHRGLTRLHALLREVESHA